MTRAVYKYRLMDHHGRQFGPFKAPTSLRPLFVGMQASDLCLWAEVQPSGPEKLHSFIVVGTGHEIPAAAEYVGSCQDGAFVWHVYQENDRGS